MTLKQLLSTLKTENVLATVIDSDDNEVCKIYASGVDSLEDSLEAREVTRWKISGTTAIQIVIADAATTEP